jgi:cobalt-zinc-cadmium resistance protein CzcA
MNNAAGGSSSWVHQIVYFSVYHRWITVLMCLSAAAAGIYAFQHLPIDAVPDITNVQVQINSPVEGFAPEEIERTITFPVESAMSGMDGVNQVRSLTRFGLSQVTVVFEDRVEIYRARQMVSERLQAILKDLPPKVRPQLGPVTTGLGEVFHYVLEADHIELDPGARLHQLSEIRALQDWYVKPRVRTVEGVADVNTIGGYEKQFHIQPDPEKMARYAIHFNDISDALGKVNVNVGGGLCSTKCRTISDSRIGVM